MAKNATVRRHHTASYLPIGKCVVSSNRVLTCFTSFEKVRRSTRTLCMIGTHGVDDGGGLKTWSNVGSPLDTYFMLCMIGKHGVDDGGGGANVGRGRAQLALLQTR